jgi:hypothetical protein
LATLAGLLPARAEQILFASDFARSGTNGWRNVPLYKGLTDYSVHRDGTNFFMHAAASNSCSAFTMKLDLQPPQRVKLRWRWRIDSVNTNASDRELKTFDHAARVFVAFDTFIGPPRTLDYYWANVEPVGTMLEHPLTGRVKNFFIESGNAKAGQWITEERDITADWQRAFPGKDMPKIEAVGMLTDGDSLNIQISGDYADIQLIAE